MGSYSLREEDRQLWGVDFRGGVGGEFYIQLDKSHFGFALFLWEPKSKAVDLSGRPYKTRKRSLDLARDEFGFDLEGPFGIALDGYLGPARLSVVSLLWENRIEETSFTKPRRRFGLHL